MEAQIQPRQGLPHHSNMGAPATPGWRREVFALDEGEVVITLPNRLPADIIEDVEAWLEIVARKLRRMAAPPQNADLGEGSQSVAA